MAAAATPPQYAPPATAPPVAAAAAAAAWRAVTDANGRVYYWNQSTNETSWTPPLSPSVTAPSAPPIPPSPYAPQAAGGGGFAPPPAYAPPITSAEMERLMYAHPGATDLNAVLSAQDAELARMASKIKHLGLMDDRSSSSTGGVASSVTESVKAMERQKAELLGQIGLLAKKEETITQSRRAEEEAYKREAELLKQSLEERERQLREEEMRTGGAASAEQSKRAEEIRLKLAEAEAAKTEVSKQLAVEQDKARRLKGIESVFVMDCTGSMQPWIDACKQGIQTIRAEMTRLHQQDTGPGGPKPLIKFAFVGYRDYADERKEGDKHVFVIPFDDPQMEAKLGNQTAKGGGDTAEDVAGGLEAVADLPWECTTRLVFLFADAPGHGKDYHDKSVDDDYASEKGRIEHMMRELKSDCKVDFVLCSLNDSVKKMAAIMEREFNAAPKTKSGERPQTFRVASLKDVKSFVPTVVESISKVAGFAAPVNI